MESKRFWNTKRMEATDESSKSANSKKRCHGAGDRKTGFYGRSGSEGLSDRQITAQPHANAIVKEINKTAAEKVPGIEAIYTWEDVPQQRFTTAGQTYPEATPYDRLILDQHVRFVGDPVAIIAGEDEACVEKAMRLIKVKYEVLPAILDFHVAKTTRSWFIRKITGDLSVRLERTISEIFVPQRDLKKAMWTV